MFAPRGTLPPLGAFTPQLVANRYTPTTDRITMTKLFLLIEDNADAYIVSSDDDSTLRTIQGLVDGYVECLSANRRVIGFESDAWVNEDGLSRNDFGINLVASYLTGRQIVGPAVIARFSHDTGETLGLGKAHIQRLVNDGLMVEGLDEAYSLADIISIRSERTQEVCA